MEQALACLLNDEAFYACGYLKTRWQQLDSVTGLFEKRTHPAFDLFLLQHQNMTNIKMIAIMYDVISQDSLLLLFCYCSVIPKWSSAFVDFTVSSLLVQKSTNAASSAACKSVFGSSLFLSQKWFVPHSCLPVVLTVFVVYFFSLSYTLLL